MFEMFSSWEWWQIALTAVFGAVWVVFIILDFRRKSKIKKLFEEKRQELKAQGYSDDVINEMLQHRTKELFLKDGVKK